MSTMSKRKISCLNCRSKKIKCDGNKPCHRCELKEIECIYKKPGQAGRPPKNAVVNKFVLARPSSQFCREFIFENVTMATRYLNDSKTIGLAYHLSHLFTTFVYQVTSNQLTKKRVRRSANGKVNDLTHYFTWMSSDLSEIMVQRLSKLRLSQYDCTEFLSQIVQADPSSAFFDHSQALVLKNPLNSIPTDQALRLIDCFFIIHPYSMLINKTMLLQAYWTDTADPLLLSVIYGTTLFLSRVLDGNPLDIWDNINLDKRNPFIEYTHVLLSRASSEVTSSRFQAVVLLAVFEITFGFAKKALSLFALAYMFARKLGLEDNALPEETTPIEKELILITFWSIVQCTARGCIELSKLPRSILYYKSFALPPTNTSNSLSYQLDAQNNHIRTLKHYDYLVESFYIQCVISRLVNRILVVLELDTVEQEIGLALFDFDAFIQQERHTFSDLQLFTFELYYAFYRICLSFLRKSKKLGNGSRLPKDLDLTDPSVVRLIYQVMPETVSVVDKILCFLHDHPDQLPSLLPRSIMVMVMDVVTKILIYHYTLEPSPLTLQCLETLEVILLQDLVWRDWDSVGFLRPIIRDFLNQHNQVTSFDWLDSASLLLGNSLVPFPDFDLLGVNFMQ
ncbi:unnamed protein product [Rhizopus stolonifer]